MVPEFQVMVAGYSMPNLCGFVLNIEHLFANRHIIDLCISSYSCTYDILMWVILQCIFTLASIQLNICKLSENNLKVDQYWVSYRGRGDLCNTGFHIGGEGDI